MKLRQEELAEDQAPAREKIKKPKKTKMKEEYKPTYGNSNDLKRPAGDAWDS